MCRQRLYFCALIQSEQGERTFCPISKCAYCGRKFLLQAYSTLMHSSTCLCAILFPLSIRSALRHVTLYERLQCTCIIRSLFCKLHTYISYERNARKSQPSLTSQSLTSPTRQTAKIVSHRSIYTYFQKPKKGNNLTLSLLSMRKSHAKHFHTYIDMHTTFPRAHFPPPKFTVEKLLLSIRRLWLD